MRLAPAAVLCAIAVAALSSAGFAADAGLLPGRQAEIEALLPQWEQVKSDARGMSDQLLNRIRGDASFNYSEWSGEIDELWRQSDVVEDAQRGAQDEILRRLDEMVGQGTLSASDRAAAADAAKKIFELRMVYTYGNMMPRALDACIVDNGQEDGRNYVGPSWRITITDDEQHTLDRFYESELPPSLLALETE